jgi:hypothetical protein
MTSTDVNRVAAKLPLICSALALMLVAAAIATGVRPQPDEGAIAHMWQLLMAAQVPLIFGFLVTADWRTRRPLLMLGLQIGFIAMACLPVWLGGY